MKTNISYSLLLILFIQFNLQSQSGDKLAEYYLDEIFKQQQYCTGHTKNHELIYLNKIFSENKEYIKLELAARLEFSLNYPQSLEYQNYLQKVNSFNNKGTNEFENQLIRHVIHFNKPDYFQEQKLIFLNQNFQQNWKERDSIQIEYISFHATREALKLIYPIKDKDLLEITIRNIRKKSKLNSLNLRYIRLFIKRKKRFNRKIRKIYNENIDNLVEMNEKMYHYIRRMTST